MNKNLHSVAATVILVNGNKFLMTQRSYEEDTFPGKWTIPGGKLKINDYIDRKKDTLVHWYNIIEKLLRRELKEETNLELGDIKYLTSLSFLLQDGIPMLVLSFYSEYIPGEIKYDKDTINHAWVSIEEATNYDLIEGIYEELEMLDRILKGQKFEEWRKSIIINDLVYGEEKINEPILIELINSKLVQRLKKISQYGIPDKYYHKKNYSRYDHSIGVLILLRRLGANLEEQIAGLLHDISHTAFSHVIDWVIGDSTKEDFQDNNHLSMIENSEIPAILIKYNIDYNKISNLEYFSILEREAPCLCADRIDYTLRELKQDGLDINVFLNDLICHENMIVFKNIKFAENFAREYLRLQNEHWAGPQAKVRYYILASIIKCALENNILTISDLISYTDEDIVKKLEESSFDVITNNLRLLKNGLKIEEMQSNNGILLKKKFRYIDPEVFFNGVVKRLSELSLEYNNFLEREKKENLIEKRYIYNALCS